MMKIFEQTYDRKKNKIIVWLDLKKNHEKNYEDIIEAANNIEKGPKIIIFNKVKDMLLFLNYLFKLKP